MQRLHIFAVLLITALMAALAPASANAQSNSGLSEASDVDFGDCRELSTGTVADLSQLQDRVPDPVQVLSLTDQGTVFPGSDELGIVIARVLSCDSITVTRDGRTRTHTDRHIAHIGTPVDTSILPASPFNNDGVNGGDFNNYIFAYYSDSWLYREAMTSAGVSPVAYAHIAMQDQTVSDCVLDRSISVQPRDGANYGFTASGVIPDAACEEPVVPFIANWWSVNEGQASVLSNNIVGQSAIFIDTATTIVNIEANSGSELNTLFGGSSAVADAFGVVGFIPQTDGTNMVITPAGAIVDRTPNCGPGPNGYTWYQEDCPSDMVLNKAPNCGPGPNGHTWYQEDCPNPISGTVIRKSGMSVTVQAAGTHRVHSVVAPEQVFANATHIVETDNALVVFDTQFLLPNALDLRAYADSLGKPIEAVFITHSHPDHFLGSEAFADLDVHALAEVSADIAANGDAEVAEKQGQFGPALIASTYVVPQPVAPGTVTIDGVSFELSRVLDAEAHVQMVIRIPEANTIVTGDLIYSGVHLILAGAPDTWTTAIEGLAADSADYPVVLPGHGLATDPSVYAENIAWLSKAAELLGTVTTGAEFKQALIDAFPDLGMEAAIDFVFPFLFPEG